MRYEYQHPVTKDIRCIHMRMSEDQPEAVQFAADGSWAACDLDAPDAYGRIISIPQVNEQRITGKFGYFSRTLPRNVAGEETNKHGQVLVKNKQHARELCRKTGYQQFD